MLAIAVVGAVGAVLRNYFSDRVSQSVGAELRRDMYANVQRLSLSNIDRLQRRQTFGMPRRTMPADVLQKAIDEYNAGILAGSDAFGRTSRAKVIGDGPNYAIELAPATLYALGALESDESGNVLDWDDQPIARLPNVSCSKSLRVETFKTELGIQ